MNKYKYLIIIFIMMNIPGCAPNHIYRNSIDSICDAAVSDCKHHALQKHQVKADDSVSNAAVTDCDDLQTRQSNQAKPGVKRTATDYLLGFVEIDDQGQLRERKQMQFLLNNLYNIASKESVLMTVFVHGWHHNAEDGDCNIEGFKDTLKELARYETLKTAENRRKIIGVYVGWRGESINVPVIRQLTFWDRKNTAHDIGYLGITELLLKLEEVANIRNSLDPPIKSRLVTIGHSFGGAVVFSATAQILMTRFVDSYPGKNFVDSAKGFGDLVVLLNPAFEALRYAPAFDLSQDRGSFPFDQIPKLAILTSETDRATDWLFPLGRFFSTVFETHNDIQRSYMSGHSLALDEGKADRNTVGHYEPLVSHRLAPAQKEKAGRVVELNKLKHFWANQQDRGTTQFGDAVLTHLGNTEPDSPYLNIRVDPALMDGHNDIFGNSTREFIELLIQMSTVDETKNSYCDSFCPKAEGK